MIRYALYLTARQWPYAVTVAILTGFFLRPEWLWLWASLLGAWVTGWWLARAVRLHGQRETARRRTALIGMARAGGRDEGLSSDEEVRFAGIERGWAQEAAEPDRGPGDVR